MVESLHVTDSVVPRTQHGTQPMAGPDPIPFPDLLNWTRPMFGPDQGSFRHTSVTARAQPFHVLGAVCPEDLRL